VWLFKCDTHEIVHSVGYTYTAAGDWATYGHPESVSYWRNKTNAAIDIFGLSKLTTQFDTIVHIDAKPTTHSTQI